MGFKEGKDRTQVVMYSLDEIVDPESMARVIDRFVEVVDLEKLGFTNCEFAATGRPPYSSKALCKLHIYGYENWTRSSRRLEKETHRNVEVMWMMESLTPDHKTIAEFRRKNIRPLQKLFREFVKLCKSWNLIGGELIVVDGSKFKASNNKKNNFSMKKIDDRLARLEAQIQKYLDEAEAADSTDDAEEVKNPAGLQALLDRKELYEEYKSQLERSGENELSTVDPDARLMGNNRGGVDVAYNVQSAVDGKHDIIVNFDVSMNPSDQDQLSNMVKKVKKTLRFRRFTALADKGYYNGADLLRVKKLKVTAIVAKQRPANPKDQPEEFWSDKFIYNQKTDTYTCPEGHTFISGNDKKAKRRNYRNKSACASCPHNADCVRGEVDYRTVTRSQYGKIYDETDKRFAENKELYKRRQQIIEHPFGTVKQTQNGGYFLLRTRRKVRAEVALLFLGYNLKRAVKVLGFEGIMARLAILNSPIFELTLINCGNFAFFTRFCPKTAHT